MKFFWDFGALCGVLSWITVIGHLVNRNRHRSGGA